MATNVKEIEKILKIEIQWLYLVYCFLKNTCWPKVSIKEGSLGVDLCGLKGLFWSANINYAVTRAQENSGW